MVGAGQGQGVLHFHRGDERFPQARAAVAGVLDDCKGRRASDHGAVHDAGIAGVVEVEGVAGGGVDHRRPHGMHRFAACQQHCPTRTISAEGMAADRVGQRRAATGDDDADGVEDAALGLVQGGRGNVVDGEVVRELTAMGDDGGRAASH